ncbi:MAG: sigma-70 family RNA polymerase sigma factor, partial [Planctomycetaceae bacterium]
LERAMATVRQRVEAHTWQAFWSTAMDGLSGQDAGDALGMTADCVHSARARVQRLISREVRRINNLVPGDGQS